MIKKPFQLAADEAIITNMDIVSPIITGVKLNITKKRKNKKIIKSIS
jgi:hypothetical protein